MGEVKSPFLEKTGALKGSFGELEAAIRTDHKAQIRRACDDLREIDHGYRNDLKTLAARLGKGKPNAVLLECAAGAREIYGLTQEVRRAIGKAGKRLSPHLVSDLAALLGPLETELEAAVQAAGLELPQPAGAGKHANPPPVTEGCVQEVA